MPASTWRCPSLSTSGPARIRRPGTSRAASTYARSPSTICASTPGSRPTSRTTASSGWASAAASGHPRAIPIRSRVTTRPAAGSTATPSTTPARSSSPVTSDRSFVPSTPSAARKAISPSTARCAPRRASTSPCAAVACASAARSSARPVSRRTASSREKTRPSSGWRRVDSPWARRRRPGPWRARALASPVATARRIFVCWCPSGTT